MIEQATMNEVKRLLVEQAQTDTVGLWTVVWDIEHAVPTVTADEAMRATLAVIRARSNNPATRAPQPFPKFAPWSSRLGSENR